MYRLLDLRTDRAVSGKLMPAHHNPLNSSHGLGENMKWFFSASFALLAVPGAVLAQDYYSPTSAARTVSFRQAEAAPEPDGEAKAEEEGEDDEKKEDSLDFLNQDVSAVRSTAVSSAAPAMQAEVSSVSRSAQPLSRTPAAITVVTNEQIRRCGARNLPDVLRTVPGLSVAQIRAGTWAVSARGQTSEFANKMLVQIDGRPIYNNIFAGTYWDINPVPLEDIDRIEVIRGPGATVWGANAVNGVINIVTKDTKDTQGAFAEVGGGSVEKLFSTARYGGTAWDGATYRVYGNQLERDAGGVAPGYPYAFDDYGFGQGGFRFDQDLTDCDKLTVSGDFLNARSDDFLASSVFMDTRNVSRAGNILARYTHTIDDDTDWSFQGSYDEFLRNLRTAVGTPVTTVGQQTVNLDLQYRFALNDYNSIVTGLNYRNANMEGNMYPAGPLSSQFIPPNQRFYNAGFFIQDTITLEEDLLYTTLGIKLEDNAYTNFVWQPSARIVYTPTERRSFWGAYSRAVRVPSYLDRTIQYGVPVSPSIITLLRGSDNVAAEVVNTFELGMRSQPTDKFYWDVAAFYFQYTDLVTYSQVGMIPGPTTVVLTDLNNQGSAQNSGVELAGNYDVSEKWKLRSGYSFLNENGQLNGATNFFAVQPGYAPRNQLFLVSSHQFDPCTQFDLTMRYVDALQPPFSNPAVNVPSYIEMDARIARHISDYAEVSVVGRNLLDGQHQEWGGSSFTTSDVRRSVYGMMTIRY